MTTAPEGYPFPNDRVIYCSAYDDFDPAANSYISLARLPEDHTVEINGKEHTNSHRLVIHSPVRGPTSFLVNPAADAQGLLSAVLTLMAEDESKRGGLGTASFNPEFFERKLGVRIPLETKDGAE